MSKYLQNFRADTETVAQIEALKQKTRLTKTEIFRQAIENFAKKHGIPK
jgi:predicted transcriptional regulator